MAATPLWLQFAHGSAGLDANLGKLSAASGTRGIRLVESIMWQVGALGGQAQAMVQNDKVGATGLKITSSTVLKILNTPFATADSAFRELTRA